MLKDNILNENILRRCMPVIFTVTSAGELKEGNAMGKAEGYILIPDKWEIENSADIFSLNSSFACKLHTP